ncbi:nitroreductase/quinone reductase family protein [Mycobacterium sp.]|uniref:nitroreductase/quinone reductase family protein n=1 Tax=Mycobacterium sp. TaxID=1785 RepID=UPI003D1474D4
MIKQPTTLQSDLFTPNRSDRPLTFATRTLQLSERTDHSAAAHNQTTGSFTTLNGTRGARQPRGRFVRWRNARVAQRLRRGGTINGIDGLILDTIGAKSGTPRRTPLIWFPDGPRSWLIVASANGAANSPSWYYNLAACPCNVRIHLGGGSGGRMILVAAEELHHDAREAAWQQITGTAPQFAQYQQRTDRRLPVIRLTIR